MSIFKAYDIRGKYPSELNESIAYKIGRAIVQSLGKEICIGRDMRISSPSLFEALVKGTLGEGADVTDIGLCSTPMFYFAMGNYGFKAGLMITASHNPAEYNGLKICREGAVPVGLDSGLSEIRALVEQNKFENSGEKGSVTKKDITEDYAGFINRFVREIKGLKIVVDAANAMAGLSVPLVFKNQDIELIPLYFELDGSFPNHEADPLKKENLRDLQKKVREAKADLGIAFDGDADRAFFVDENSKPISADLVTALIAKDYLRENQGARIVYDLRSSKIVEETIRENNGIGIKNRVGHTFIKHRMKQEDALFGGELSGHYFFKENFNCDNALLAAVKVMNIMCRERKTLSELIKPFQKYYHTGEINFKAENKEEIMNLLKEHYKDARQLEIDGVYIEYPGWWFNVRPSNTEPLLRLNLEADTIELMDNKKEGLKIFIQQHAK